MLSIGALARATAIPVETLRTWERRYGYPVPRAQAIGPSALSGAQRAAPPTDRAGARRRDTARARWCRRRMPTCVRCSRRRPPSPVRRPPRPPSGSSTADLLDAVRAFDGERRDPAAARGVGAARTARVPDRVRRAAGASASATPGRRAHSRCATSTSSPSVWRPAAVAAAAVRRARRGSARGPELLPGESHSLGLHMAALVLATSRCRVLVLGTEVPPPQLAELARDLRARAVGISVSAARPRAPPPRAGCARSGPLLPRRTALLVGGEGAPAGRPGRHDDADDLGQLETWARQAVRAAPERRASVEEVAAVHVERLAGDRARQVGGEEQRPRPRSRRSRGCGGARCATRRRRAPPRRRRRARSARCRK